MGLPLSDVTAALTTLAKSRNSQALSSLWQTCTYGLLPPYRQTPRRTLCSLKMFGHKSLSPFSVGTSGDLKSAPMESFSLKYVVFGSKITPVLLTSGSPLDPYCSVLPAWALHLQAQPYPVREPVLTMAERRCRASGPQEMEPPGALSCLWEAQTSSCPPCLNLLPRLPHSWVSPSRTEAPVPALLLSLPLLWRNGAGLVFLGRAWGLLFNWTNHLESKTTTCCQGHRCHAHSQVACGHLPLLHYIRASCSSEALKLQCVKEYLGAGEALGPPLETVIQMPGPSTHPQFRVFLWKSSVIPHPV